MDKRVNLGCSRVGYPRDTPKGASMIYLLAAIGAATVAFLLWRMLSAERVGVTAQQKPIAPDDDPEFLRRIAEQQKKNKDDESS
ncbi:hypothetical protein SacazDRAFT_03077 [Saccharomonospora azurea NA-128]|uniref:Uncharacterized protein n=2 Tax=Saccharomonospora azurea TaxID=40988 RepID=H8GEP8_9PSEU|nr:hypothetical protein SacazDRAFT_03077 [Saccharomonospora azurea NA-128]